MNLTTKTRILHKKTNMIKNRIRNWIIIIHKIKMMNRTSISLHLLKFSTVENAKAFFHLIINFIDTFDKNFVTISRFSSMLSKIKSPTNSAWISSWIFSLLIHQSTYSRTSTRASNFVNEFMLRQWYSYQSKKSSSSLSRHRMQCQFSESKFNCHI